MSILRCLLVLMAIIGSATSGSAADVVSARHGAQQAHAAGADAAVHHAGMPYGAGVRHATGGHGSRHHELADDTDCDRHGGTDRPATGDDASCCDPGACCPGVKVLSLGSEDRRVPRGFGAASAARACIGAAQPGLERPPRAV